jgi:hypothetical protein
MTVTVTESDGAEVAPEAGSVCVAVNVVGPSGSAVVGVHDHVPSVCTVAVQTVSPSSFTTVTSSPGMPVPATAGVASAVSNPSTGDVITGASGITFTVTGADASEVVPDAGSVWVAVSVEGPSGSAVAGVHDHVPSACTVAVQTVLPSASLTVTSSPAVPVPEIVGVASVVDEPSAGDVIAGTVGAIVKVSGDDAADVVPETGSVCVAVTVFEPSGSAVVGVHDQVPSACTVAVQRVAPVPSVTVTVSPAVPLPEIVGVVSVVVEPDAGAVIVGATGTIVKVFASDAGETTPVGAVWVAVTVWLPSAMAVVGVHDQLPSV